MHLHGKTPWPSRAAVRLALSLCLAIGPAAPRVARADFAFNGVASGEMTSNDATLWTRGLDTSNPANARLSVQVAADPTSQSIVKT